MLEVAAIGRKNAGKDPDKSIDEYNNIKTLLLVYIKDCTLASLTFLIMKNGTINKSFHLLITLKDGKLCIQQKSEVRFPHSAVPHERQSQGKSDGNLQNSIQNCLTSLIFYKNIF